MHSINLGIERGVGGPGSNAMSNCVTNCVPTINLSVHFRRNNFRSMLMFVDESQSERESERGPRAPKGRRDRRATNVGITIGDYSYVHVLN